jgi:two-component system, sensor histidine kinase and response regulator
MTEQARPLVLVAEDHPVNQKVIGLLLNMLGVDTDMVTNGRAAIEAARSDTYNMILMDIMMPDVDGFEAAFAIRKREFGKCRHTPIIACTALDKDKIKDQLIHSGMDDYIAKPISRDILKEKIERWSHIRLQLQPVTHEMEMQVKRLNGEVKESTSEPIDQGTLQLLYGLEQLDDVLVLFMTVTETLLAQLESAIEHRDVAVVRRMAHEIKGSSYAVSAKEMSELCLKLEQAGETQNWSEAEKLYTALGLAFARVREFLSKKPADTARRA